MQPRPELAGRGHDAEFAVCSFAAQQPARGGARRARVGRVPMRERQDNAAIEQQHYSAREFLRIAPSLLRKHVPEPALEVTLMCSGDSGRWVSRELGQLADHPGKATPSPAGMHCRPRKVAEYALHPLADGALIACPAAISSQDIDFR